MNKVIYEIQRWVEKLIVAAIVSVFVLAVVAGMIAGAFS
jgi:hypothetical protein